MSVIFGVPVDAAYHLVLALTSVLAPVLGGLAAAAGVILLTIAIRLLVSPLSFRALRGQAAQARLAPQLQALRKRYARQPERLQRELTALYTREGTSMFAGIWPILVQWPLFSVLYLLFRAARVAGRPNVLLSHELFGVPLGGHWLSTGLSAASVLSPHGAVFLGVLAILAGVCWLSARLARRMTPAVPAVAAGRVARSSAGRVARSAAGRPGRVPAGRPGRVPAGARRPTASQGPAGSGAVGLLTKVLPYATVVIAAFAPLAAGLYLTTSAAWGVAEREVFRRRSARVAAGDLAPARP